MSLSTQYKKSWGFIKQSKNYIWFSVLVVFLFALIGFIFPVFFEKEIIAFVEQLKLSFEGLSVLETIWKIFLNNTLATFFAIVLGVFIGLFPITSAVVNGYLIGFVANHAVAERGILVLWRLLPHVIFELPAVFISIGLGLRIGIGLLKEENLKKNFVNALRVFVFVVLPLLIIAGIIEGVLVGLGV